MARKKSEFLTNGFSTPATTSVTWDKRWISAMSTCLVTRDGRIDRNSTVPELDAQFEIPHPGLQKKTWTHVSSYFVEVDKNLCSCSMALGFFPLKDKNQLGIIFGISSFRPH